MACAFFNLNKKRVILVIGREGKEYQIDDKLVYKSIDDKLKFLSVD